MRREARERREATRRRARSAGRDEGSRGSGDDAANDSDDEIIITAAGTGEQIRLLPGRRDILVRHRALVRGYIPARVPGRNVVLEVRTDGRWWRSTASRPSRTAAST